MNFIKKIYYRLVKNVEIYGIENVHFGKGSQLNNGVVLNSRRGKILLGKNTRVGRYSEIQSGKNRPVEIKDYSTLYSNCKVLGNVTIERYCVLANNIYISSGNHIAFQEPEMLIRKQDALFMNKCKLKKVHIEEDVWIGAGVFIANGITVGWGAVIGSNAVITKDIEPYHIVGGIPAKLIKKRLEFQPKNAIDHTLIAHWPYFYRGFNHKTENEAIKKSGFEILDKSCLVILFSKNKASQIELTGFSKFETTLEAFVGETKTFECKIKGDFNPKFNVKNVENNINLEFRISNLIPKTIFIKTVKIE